MECAQNVTSSAGQNVRFAPAIDTNIPLREVTLSSAICAYLVHIVGGEHARLALLGKLRKCVSRMLLKYVLKDIVKQ